MIRVTIEDVPNGDAARARTVATATIVSPDQGRHEMALAVAGQTCPWVAAVAYDERGPFGIIGIVQEGLLQAILGRRWT